MIKNKPELDKIPIIAGADFGHTTPIITFPIGGYAKLKANNDEINLTVKGWLIKITIKNYYKTISENLQKMIKKFVKNCCKKYYFEIK